MNTLRKARISKVRNNPSKTTTILKQLIASRTAWLLKYNKSASNPHRKWQWGLTISV